MNRTVRAWQGLFILLFIVISDLALSPTPPEGLSTGWDKANHALAFAALAVSGRCAWTLRPLPLAIALLAYGGAIELLQMHIPNRDGDWHDLLADGVGIVLGLALAAVISHVLRRRPPAADRR